MSITTTLGTGSASSVKFANIGDSVTGQVTGAEDVPETIYGSAGQVARWPDGTERIQTRITLITGTDEYGDPVEVTLWAKGRIRSAIDAALKAAGAQLAMNGRLTVTFTGTKPAAAGGAIPAKLYEAVWEPPRSAGDDVPPF